MLSDLTVSNFDFNPKLPLDLMVEIVSSEWIYTPVTQWQLLPTENIVNDLIWSEAN